MFAATDSIIPLLTEIPDTLVERDLPHLKTLLDVDQSRTLMVFGDGGSFKEADGTSYTTEGTSSSSEEVEITLTSGIVEVGGLQVHIEGTTERLYRVVVTAP